MPNPVAPQVVSVYPFDSYDFGGGLPVITNKGVTVSLQGQIDSLVTAAAAVGVALYFGAVPGTGAAQFNVSTAAQTLSRTQQIQALANLGLGVGTTIAYAAAITPNIDSFDVITVGQLTGNITINAPTGTPDDGQEVVFRFSTDGTAGRTITWNAAFAFGTDITAAGLPTTANSKFEVKFRYDVTSAKWRAIQQARGF
jgi:hypothetical protein